MPVVFAERAVSMVSGGALPVSSRRMTLKNWRASVSMGMPYEGSIQPVFSLPVAKQLSSVARILPRDVGVKRAQTGRIHSSARCAMASGSR